MAKDKVVQAWQDNILVQCERTLQRPLTNVETLFVRSRQGFMALEMIEDSIAAMAPAELLKYLNADFSADDQAQPDTKSNMKLFRFLLVLTAASVAIALLMWVWSEISIDRCLDSGGRWNRESSACEGAR